MTIVYLYGVVSSGPVQGIFLKVYELRYVHVVENNHVWPRLACSMQTLTHWCTGMSQSQYIERWNILQRCFIVMTTLLRNALYLRVHMFLILRVRRRRIDCLILCSNNTDGICMNTSQKVHSRRIMRANLSSSVDIISLFSHFHVVGPTSRVQWRDDRAYLQWCGRLRLRAKNVRIACHSLHPCARVSKLVVFLCEPLRSCARSMIVLAAESSRSGFPGRLEVSAWDSESAARETWLTMIDYLLIHGIGVWGRRERGIYTSTRGESAHSHRCILVPFRTVRLGLAMALMPSWPYTAT